MSVFDNFYKLDEWKEKERTRTLNLLLEHEYGFSPIKDEKLNYEVLLERNIDNILYRKVAMEYNGHKMYFALFIPKIFDKPLKTFLTIVHPFAERNGDFFEDFNTIEHFCPIRKITNNGFAVILLSAKTVAEDVKEGKATGIFKACKSEETDSSWGVLAAWAWACTKVLDYIALCPELDETKVAVIGHSRGGKTALLAGALDERFYLTISNNSGNSGAALSRENTGETIADIVRLFPYWFSNNYRKYVNNEDSLPFDQHVLIGLQAPRYCYIASASDDSWANPDGELLSAKYASQYYNLYNVSGLIIPDKIELDVSYNDGNIAYHRRTGKHKLTLFDWEQYMEYFEKISK